MMNTDFSVDDFRQRHRVLGRRADMRLADALRRPVPLPERVRRKVVRSLSFRRPVIRRWQDGSFVTQRGNWPPSAA